MQFIAKTPVWGLERKVNWYYLLDVIFLINLLDKIKVLISIEFSPADKGSVFIEVMANNYCQLKDLCCDSVFGWYIIGKMPFFLEFSIVLLLFRLCSANIFCSEQYCQVSGIDLIQTGVG